jgi:hypothetical protein
MDQDGVEDLDYSGIWTWQGGTLRLVAIERAPAPGAAEPFAQLGDPVISQRGEIVFRAALGTSPPTFGVPFNSGIWVERGGTLAPLVMTSNAAPGLGAGAKFSGFGTPTINADGRVAFWASLLDGEGGVTQDNDTGIWVQDRAGNLRLVALEGQQLDVDSGAGLDMRTISSLTFGPDVTYFFGEGSGNEDGRPSHFNNHGRLTFWAEFTDGSSGVFVTTVPEPATQLMMALAWLAAFAGPRRLNRCLK